MEETSAFLFDLDGTLLDTLPDLVVLTNTILERHGVPTRTRDEVLSFVGDGARALLQRAFPTGTEQSVIEKAYIEFQSLYDELGIVLTQPYPGIAAVLEKLKGAGMRLGVLSNKYDAGAIEVVARFFPGLIDVCHGERESAGIPRKPDPKGLLLLAEELDVDPADCIYFGDSGGDMTTGKRAGMRAIGCTWGYQSREQLLANGADRLIDSTEEILQFLP